MIITIIIHPAFAQTMNGVLPIFQTITWFWFWFGFWVGVDGWGLGWGWGWGWGWVGVGIGGGWGWWVRLIFVSKMAPGVGCGGVWGGGVGCGVWGVGCGVWVGVSLVGLVSEANLC